MLVILTSMLFYLIPVAATAFFVVSLCAFVIAKQKNKSDPNTYSAEQVKTRKYMLIISSVILGVLLAVVIAFIALIFTAVAFM